MEAVQFPDLAAGSIIFGRYRISKCLGIGSIGTVYGCELVNEPGKMIALKVLSPKAANDPKIIAAFRNEINASYRVNCSNVVRCYEFFRDEEFLAIAMEYVDGPSLSSYIKPREPLPPEQALDFLTQMTTGLSAIHTAGIIHHDLKPQNILLTNSGVLKIADFTASCIGIQRQYNSSSSVFGTIQFLSPETLMYGWVDRRSDIYALGVMAYLMFTGHLPFSGDDVVSQLQNKIYAKISPADSVNPECPYMIARIIDKAMARHPERRFQKADEILEILQRADLAYRPGFFDRLFGNSGIAGL